MRSLFVAPSGGGGARAVALLLPLVMAVAMTAVAGRGGGGVPVHGAEEEGRPRLAAFADTSCWALVVASLNLGGGTVAQSIARQHQNAN